MVIWSPANSLRWMTASSETEWPWRRNVSIHRWTRSEPTHNVSWIEVCMEVKEMLMSYQGKDGAWGPDGAMDMLGSTW